MNRNYPDLEEPECALPDLDRGLPLCFEPWLPLCFDPGLPLPDFGLPERDLAGPAGDGLLLPDPDLEATELLDGDGDPEE